MVCCVCGSRRLPSSRAENEGRRDTGAAVLASINRRYSLLSTRSLQQENVVGLLGDEYTIDHGIPVPFCHISIRTTGTI